MRKRVTAVLSLLLLLVGYAHAQDATEVTVREINQIPDENIQQLQEEGPDMAFADIQNLVMSELEGETVRFTAVVLTDPLNSGLASVDEDGLPGRIHAFVRDTTANSQGKAGMDIQVVDGDYQTSGLINVLVGDVITITGTVAYFGPTVQLEPTTIEPQGTIQDVGLPESIMDPVVVTTSDLNMMVDEQVMHINWDNFNDLNNQYVRVENATILRRTLADTGRPSWGFTSDGGDTFIQNDDLSLRYRNDRTGDYPDNFNVRSSDNPFQPPAVGSVVNVQGFVLFRSDFEAFDYSAQPGGAWLNVAPFSDDDLEITQEPTVTLVQAGQPDVVPGADPVTITAEVEAQEGAVAQVTLDYSSSAGEEGSVEMQEAGDGTYEGDIPPLEDGAFVTYSVTVEDTEGIDFTSEEQTYRVLVDGIDEIEDIQFTASGGFGSSPFSGITTAMNITATVQSDSETSGFLAVQDNADLEPWTGILIDSEGLPPLSPGDVVTITEATIEESFDVTQLTDVTLEVGESGDPLGYKTVTTDVLQDEAIAEAHEGMTLRFEDVVITSTNPDAPSGPFGEWAFSSDGTEENQLRADDASDGISFGDGDDASTRFAVWERISFLQGIWWFSFGNYKLVPESEDDIGEVTNVAVDDEAVPERFALEQNYPNPFNPATTIRYAVPQNSQVKLAVFDVLGRQVATLVDREQAAGTYEVTFRAPNLPSGLYLYRLEAGSKVQTKQMLLIK